jgi:prolyl-tRNA editing enzyme YbaK/EbsC (Cys-tRNA(Pro) deacylase)
MIPISKFDPVLGIHPEYIEVSQLTRTAADAAQALKTSLDRIVKSLLFIIDGQPVLIMVAGDRKADLGKIRSFFSTDSVRMANADEVKKITGFAIGVVPPYGHKGSIKTFIDASLINKDFVFYATGKETCLAKLSPQELIQGCGAEPINV